MSLLNLARRDIKNITGNGRGFATALTFTTPDGQTTATINGLATAHSFVINSEGLAVNSKNYHCSFAESLLTAEGYTTRSNGKVYLKDHKVSWTDATGTEKTYKIEDWMPDDTVGIIPLRLGAYTE